MKSIHDMLEASISSFTTYYLYYKETLIITDSVYNSFLFWVPPKLLFLFNMLSECIIKFGTHHSHYKEKSGMIESIYNFHQFYSNKLVSNLTRSFIYATSYFYIGYSLGSLEDLSVASFFAYNDRTYAIELGLVTKNGKALKTFLYLSNTFQSLLFILSLMFSKI